MGVYLVCGESTKVFFVKSHISIRKSVLPRKSPAIQYRQVRIRMPSAACSLHQNESSSLFELDKPLTTEHYNMLTRSQKRLQAKEAPLPQRRPSLRTSTQMPPPLQKEAANLPGSQQPHCIHHTKDRIELTSEEDQPRAQATPIILILEEETKADIWSASTLSTQPNPHACVR